MSEVLVCLKDIHFAYNRELVLEDIDLHIERGSYLGLLGPNGSGKSTLLKIILGLIKPQKGEVELFGQPQNKFKDHFKIGYVPQKATQIQSQFPISVEEVISLTAVSKKAAHQALTKVGMYSHRTRLITELSGGEQQRVFIAKALAASPEILLLDEPTVGIDNESQKDFYSLLRELNKEGLTIVIVSHDTEDIIKEVSRVVCVNRRLVCHVSPKEFIEGHFQDELYGDDRKKIIHHHSHA